MAAPDEARDVGDGVAARGCDVGLEGEEVEGAAEGAGIWSAGQRQWLEVEVLWKKAG